MRVGLIVLLSLLPCGVARAWGGDGHRIIAQLAERFLTPEARTQISGLLPPRSTLSGIANWADEYRSRCANTGPWHYVNIPIAAKHYDAEHACPEATGCVVSATERALAILSDARRTTDERSFALRLVVHFIGDLHQPLHSGDRGDRGGNDLRVQFGDRKLSLHAVWDYALIAWTGRSVADYVDMLARSLSTAEAGRFRRGSVLDWTLESQRAARRVYQKLPDHYADLEDDYAPAVLAILDDQLLRGGVRLAAALEAALRPSGATVTDAEVAAAQACTAPAPRRGAKALE